MPKINLLLFVFILNLSAVNSQNNCYSKDSIVQILMNSIEQKDLNKYFQLWNKEKFVNSLKCYESDRKKNLENNLEKIELSHKNKFENIIKQLKIQLFTDVFKIDIISYNYTVIKELPCGITDWGLEITFVINGVTRKIYTAVTETDGCFYIFEPISDFIQNN